MLKNCRDSFAFCEVPGHILRPVSQKTLGDAFSVDDGGEGGLARVLRFWCRIGASAIWVLRFWPRSAGQVQAGRAA